MRKRLLPFLLAVIIAARLLPGAGAVDDGPLFSENPTAPEAETSTETPFTGDPATTPSDTTTSATGDPAVAAPTDIDGHWAKDYILYLEKEDIYNPSFSDAGAYKPDQKVSRAEFMRYVNRALHFTEKTAVSYTDINRDAWYNETIQIAAKYGYINGVGDNKIDPLGDITREQVAVIIGRLYKLDPGNVQPSDLRFTDNADISSWSAGYIRKAVEKGIIDGYSDGTFQPKKTITRAEVSKILYFYLGTALSEAGKVYYGTDLKEDTENVTITESCTLTDAVIKGDLYLTEGLGADAVTLSGVTVEGSIVISGGTVNMVNTTSNHMVVSCMLGRLLQTTATGVSHIQETLVQSVATLYENNLNNDSEGFEKVIVEGDERVSLTLDAELAELEVLGEATVTTTANSVIHQLTMHTLAAVTGYGTVEHADILVNGVSLANSIKVNSYTLAEGVSAKIDGQEVYASFDTSISPDTIDVDGDNLAALGDSVQLTLPEGISVLSVLCDNKTLTDVSYKLNSEGVAMLTSFLSTLSDGTHTLLIGLSNEQSVSVEVNVKNAAIAGEVDASLTFDRYYLSDGFTDRSLKLDGISVKADIQSVVLGLSPIDYEFDENTGLKLRRGVLAQIQSGVYTIAVNLKDGTAKTIRLTVTDSTPETEEVLVAEYDTYKPAEPCFKLELHGRTVKEVNAKRNGVLKLLHIGTDYHISTRGLTLGMSLLEDYRVRGSCVPFYVTMSDLSVITLVVDYL